MGKSGGTPSPHPAHHTRLISALNGLDSPLLLCLFPRPKEIPRARILRGMGAEGYFPRPVQARISAKARQCRRENCGRSRLKAIGSEFWMEEARDKYQMVYFTVCLFIYFSTSLSARFYVPPGDCVSFTALSPSLRSGPAPSRRSVNSS